MKKKKERIANGPSFAQVLLRKHHSSLFLHIALACNAWTGELKSCIVYNLSLSTIYMLNKEIFLYIFKNSFLSISFSIAAATKNEFFLLLFSIWIFYTNHRAERFSTVSILTTTQFVKQQRGRRKQYSNERRRRPYNIRE